MRRSILATAVVLALSTVAPSRGNAHPALVFGARHPPTNARKNIAIGRFDGPKSSKIRLSLMQALRDSASFTLTDAEDLKGNAGKSAIAKMAASLSVDAVLIGSVSSRHDLTLNVYRADGGLVDQIKLKGGSSTKLERAVEEQFDSAIAPPLAHASGAELGSRASAAPAPAEEEEEAEPQAAPPPEPPADEETSRAAKAREEPDFDEHDATKADEDTSEKESERDKDKDKGASKSGRTPFELTGGARLYSRNWTYSGLVGVRDPSYPRALAPYKLAAAPALLVNGIVYPGAFAADGVLANIGLMAGAELGVATSTDYQQIHADGSKTVTQLKTQAQAWDIGLRGRVPLGPAELAVFAEYGSQSFVLHGDEGGPGGLAPLVPDVQYRYIRLGGEARVRIGKVSLAGHIAPRILLTLHDVDLDAVWFPGAKGHGLDFGLMLGYGLTSFLDVVGGADYVGYGFDFSGIPADPARAPILARGASDRYESLWLALRLSLGGTPPK